MQQGNYRPNPRNSKSFSLSDKKIAGFCLPRSVLPVPCTKLEQKSAQNSPKNRCAALELTWNTDKMRGLSATGNVIGRWFRMRLPIPLRQL